MVADVHKTESRRLRRIGNFCGALVLAMYAAQSLIRLLLQGGDLLNWWDLSKPQYGLNLVGKELLDMAMYVLFLPIPAFAITLLSRSRVPSFPVRRVQPTLFVCLILLGLAMAIFSNVATSYALVFLENVGAQTAVSSLSVDASVWGLILGLISTAVIPAIFEEMVFRGFLLGALCPLGNGVAVVISAVIFGLVHGNVQQFVFAFLFGLVLAYLTVQTGSLWPAVVLHFSNNAMSVVVNYCFNFFPDAASGTITMTVFAVVAFVGGIALGALQATDRGSAEKTEIFRPLFNGRGVFSPVVRVGYLFTAPLLILAFAVMIYDVAGTVKWA